MLFQDGKLIYIRSYTGSVDVKNVDAIRNIHPVAGYQIPRLLPVIDRAGMRQRLDKMATHRINPNGTLSRQMNEIDEPRSSSNTGRLRFPRRSTNIRIGNYSNLAQILPCLRLIKCRYFRSKLEVLTSAERFFCRDSEHIAGLRRPLGGCRNECVLE